MQTPELRPNLLNRNISRPGLAICIRTIHIYLAQVPLGVTTTVATC